MWQAIKGMDGWMDEWRRYGTPKRLLTLNGILGVLSQMTVLFKIPL
jgi:hypothetical protein